MAASVLIFCYCGAFLVSAALLFSVQPMVGKMVLPLYGGSSAVWTTCMVYFQAILLAGYAYAHATTVWLGVRRQMILHAAVIVAPILVLPIAIPDGWTPTTNSNPSASLLLLLFIIVGGPLFVVSSTAPLLQRWFAETSHPSAGDPYFLYAVSNAGSMTALLSYPVLIEPQLRLSQQSWIWTAGYVVLTLLILSCGVLTWRSSVPESTSLTHVPNRQNTSKKSQEQKLTKISNGDRVWWVLLAFIPSSWMLAVTSRLTTDITPMPLLWIIPLALYLLTFILVFAKRQILPLAWISRLFPFAVTLLLVSLIVGGRLYLFSLHLLAFFLAAMLCHGELVKRRPPAQQLTEFYLWMSIGGVLGGVFNAIVAPLIFPVLLEFPIVVALACAVHPGRDQKANAKLDLGVLAAATALIGVLVNSFQINDSASVTLVILVVGTSPLLVLLYFFCQPKWFAVAVAVIFVFEQFDVRSAETLIHSTRSFFGVHRVTTDKPRLDPDTGEPLPRFRRLRHGTTDHGFQNIDPKRECEPLSYFHRSGPLGQVFQSFPEREGQQRQVAVIGLGTGTMACYASPQRRFTFFEIDPVVIRLAENPEYFTFLSGCGRDNYKIVVGDGRLQLESESDKHFDMIILDAFSSDAIPIHLLTREALAVYRQKLASSGLLVFHVSNRHLDLAKVLGDLAADAEMAALVNRDVAPSEFDREGRAPSTYVVMARNRTDLAPLAAQQQWQPLLPKTDSRPWTDDFSNIISVFRWDPLDVSRGK